VILGEVEINLNDLNTMSAGDVIKLNKKINNNLDLTIEEHNIFEAQIGRVGRNLVVQIVGLNSKTERGIKVE
jgi:flagellar motor switch protein FliM